MSEVFWDWGNASDADQRNLLADAGDYGDELAEVEDGDEYAE